MGTRRHRDILKIITSCSESMAKRLLANTVIQRYAIGEIEPVFPHPAEASGERGIPACGDLDEAGLLALSQERRAALDLAEMQAIQGYFRGEEREPQRRGNRNHRPDLERALRA